MGGIWSSRDWMLKAFIGAVFCSVVLAGEIHAQEVIVARETKPEASKQAAPPPEQTPSESVEPARTKPKSRQKKSSSAEPTLEQMRTAGARAAEGQENRRVPQSTKAGESDVEVAPPSTPSVAETPRPVKRQTPVEQKSTSRTSRSRSEKLEGVGPIRPTMMDSGREQPSASPEGKAEARGEQSPPPP